MSSHCRSCEAAVVFARHYETKRVSPWAPDAEGQWVILDGHARPFEPLLHRGEQRFTSHFATCPQAQRWRR